MHVLACSADRRGTLTRFGAWLGGPSGYLVGGLTSGVSAGLSLLAAPHASLAHVMIIYLLGAVLISTRYGILVSTFTILTSTACFDYFNIPPAYAFAIPNIHDWVTLGGMLLTAMTVCCLIQRLRYQRAVARSSEARTLALCALSLDLSQVTNVEQLPAAAEAHLVRLFGAPSRLLTAGQDGAFRDASLPDQEKALAARALGTRELCLWQPGADCVAFQPIEAARAPFGVIRAVLPRGEFLDTKEQPLLLAACADRIAVAVERLALASVASKARVETEAERLRNELLSAMSHDLKTPLGAILTAGSTLLDGAGLAESSRKILLETIVGETERLNDLVTNLLSVTRLESGRVQLNKVPEALDDLIFGVLSRLESRLHGRHVDVQVPGELPLVSMDPVLIDQVLVNLIENVLRYTPEASPIEIAVHATNAEVLLEVLDRGPGVANDEREKVFEKFYRGRRAKLKDGGSGLGLTICRAVVRAHGGHIAMRPRLGGGTCVEFALPIFVDAEPQQPLARLRGLEAAFS